MKDIKIRPMTDEDISQATNIHKNVVREGLRQGIDYEIRDLFISFIKKSPKTCIIAEKDGKVAGFIVGCIKEWGFGLDKSGWIEMVEIDPKLMGKGIGKALGEALISYFKENDINEVYTSVKWDSSDLIAFFKSIGFDKSNFINLELKTK